jgi:hypothetical protein
MKKIDIGQTMGILANAGVIAGIVFLGFELRQNTDAVEAASIESLTDLSQDFFMTLASDPELSRIWDVGSEDLSKLNESERSRFLWLARSRAVRWQSAFLQWQRGTLADKDWDYYRMLICSYAKTESWQLTQGVQLPSFTEYAKSC